MTPGVLACAGSSHPGRHRGRPACGGRGDGVLVQGKMEVLLDGQVRSRLVVEMRTGGVVASPAGENLGNPRSHERRALGEWTAGTESLTLMPMGSGGSAREPWGLRQMQVPVALQEENAVSLGSHWLKAMQEDGPGLVRASGLLKEARNLGFCVKFLVFLRPFIQALPNNPHLRAELSPWQFVDSLWGKTVRERAGGRTSGENGITGGALQPKAQMAGALSRQRVGALNVIERTMGVRLET